jgi:nitrogen fixation protein NifU and related proteins
MDVTELYEQIIIDHSKHPKGAGLREPYDAEAHHVNPTCGDEVTVRVALDGGTIRDLSYQGEGCSISRASASVLHELVQGTTLEHTLAVQDAFQALVTGRGQVEPDEELLEDAVAFAGVARYPMRVKCALLPWMAFKDATSRAVSGGKS